MDISKIINTGIKAISKVDSAISKVAQTTSNAINLQKLSGLDALSSYNHGVVKRQATLASHIDFTPAKTIEEARMFSKKYLKVRRNNLTDLNVANYVNEALCKYNNDISKDHKRVFSAIEILNKDSLMAYKNEIIDNVLYINEASLKSKKLPPEETSVLKDLISGETFPGVFSNEQISLLKKFSKNPKKISTSELQQVKQTIYKYGTACSFFNNLEIYATYLYNDKIAKYLKESSQYMPFDEYIKLPQAKKLEIFGNVSKNFGEDALIEIKPYGKFQDVFHEIGHALHEDKIGSSRFGNLRYYGENVTKEEARQRFEKQLTKPFAIHITNKVSAYATTSPNEFVAEVYTRLINGEKFDSKIMSLYNKLGGPSI